MEPREEGMTVWIPAFAMTTLSPQWSPLPTNTIAIMRSQRPLGRLATMESRSGSAK
jgi:hypothetical protein